MKTPQHTKAVGPHDAAYQVALLFLPSADALRLADAVEEATKDANDTNPREVADSVEHGLGSLRQMLDTAIVDVLMLACIAWSSWGRRSDPDGTYH